MLLHPLLHRRPSLLHLLWNRTCVFQPRLGRACVALKRRAAPRPAGTGVRCRARPTGASSSAHPTAERVRPGDLHSHLAHLMRTSAAAPDWLPRLLHGRSTNVLRLRDRRACPSTALCTTSEARGAHAALLARAPRPGLLAGCFARASAVAAWGAYWHRLAHDQPSPLRAPTPLTRPRSARTQAQPRSASSPSCSCSAGVATVPQACRSRSRRARGGRSEHAASAASRALAAAAARRRACSAPSRAPMLMPMYGRY